MALPAPYDALPPDLQETLIRSHAEFQKGWPGITPGEYLQKLDESGELDVIRDVHGRCRVLPGLWGHIDSIDGRPWTYKGGADISMGFYFRCAKPEPLLTLVRGSGFFCQDGVNCHGPRETFRELVRSGPGLHVCIVEQAERGNYLHDIHIDKYQTVCRKKSDGFCEYDYLDQNFVKHMWDVTPWFVGDQIRKAGQWAADKVGPEKPKK